MIDSANMKDPYDILREALALRDENLRPHEQSKEFFDKLKEFCDYSVVWQKEMEKQMPPRPKNPRSGEIKRGTTEADVYDALVMKTLRRNGIHL